jgi:hypothetical protein
VEAWSGNGKGDLLGEVQLSALFGEATDGVKQVALASSDHRGEILGFTVVTRCSTTA